MKRIILASMSPRRSEILQQVGINFSIVKSDINEEYDKNMLCHEIVKKLSYDKGMNVANRLSVDDAIVIAADTLVYHQGEVLGKPENRVQAVKMLQKLSSDTHSVYTGFCIINVATGYTIVDYEKTDVTFRVITNDEINKYVDTGEPMDKAGAYGIQGIGAKFVSRINGDYNNVVGLPICRICQWLGNKFEYKV